MNFTTSNITKFFRFDHLPPDLKPIAQKCAELAHSMDESLPAGAEKTAGLRKLLEAKDCFVRSQLERSL